ncbi:GTPase-activating protein skywalker isoform X1 [Frankliniella occidentalis]|uniref:GTPase-activating protein skywalker isoform X1 n=1 Tax=Frankliniella occidentalis TaxID=133901 RepID=A0A6J1TIZ9_FRAOC|nr:GTPase-activating protein skywalker isoform X1 [Frankliniella occidentalis]XP_026293247.1 GTPase-activating protein skywalker isoform X1 [Frankliniella occidentalis]XP_026293248.1 GTPase-activating protein skywalker isoform X1 [Frankliniella occidentalis]XP_052126170.1 GTPase-activating protein skywalker isoform X1 [Frankliniella occidentalis]XP_052126171.1 GTPase-activating protein skywalker isoform X1 [Frankliniella occidentalis]
MAVMLSTLEEESDMYEVFPAHVDTSSIPIVPDSPAKKNAKPLKTWSEINSLIQAGRKREVKLILREQGWPTNHTIRAQLWPALCKQHSSSRPMQDGFYWELVNQLFGTTDISDKPMLLPAFVENTHCLPYHLTRRGRSLADRVVCVLGFSCPDITYSPALYPIAALLLHFMPEEECYNSLASLISSKDKTFITQTKLLYEATWRTVMLITKKHMKSAAAHLARHCSDARSERIYADWLWWILQGLPLTHLVRVMDCFFHEGIKVLYRVAMAILFLFYKYSTSQSSEWSAELAAQGVDNALTKFCRQMPVSPTKVLRTAFNVRGLSSSYIQRVFVKTEMLLKSKPVLSNSQQISRSRSSENLPTSQSQNNIQLVSHTLTIREGSRSPEPRTHAMGVYPIYKIRSAIVSQEELFTLWSWLPVRITMYQPILLYTTEEHGCSLTTFYVRVEQHEPTLLMIKTSNNEVFGAYCSTRWYERNVKDDRGNRQAYFGTGETFLFSLYPERAKYPWVGMEQSPGEKQLDHSAELFLAADHKMITIGGGEGQAIWMDENIRYGKTDRCLTFNNPPLCPSGDFEIRVLEVYGFAGA